MQRAASKLKEHPEEVRKEVMKHISPLEVITRVSARSIHMPLQSRQSRKGDAVDESVPATAPNRSTKSFTRQSAQYEEVLACLRINNTLPSASGVESKQQLALFRNQLQAVCTVATDYILGKADREIFDQAYSLYELNTVGVTAEMKSLLVVASSFTEQMNLVQKSISVLFRDTVHDAGAIEYTLSKLVEERAEAAVV